MVVAIQTSMTTNLVTARQLNTIRREINRATGQYIIDKVLPVKFTRSAYYEYPGIVKRRSKGYTARKRKQVGHDIPWRLTGASARDIPASAQITATANGGRVKLRANWAGKATQKRGGKIARRGMRESQRQELEAVSQRQVERIARLQEKMFLAAINDPKNQRKRKLK